MNTDKKSLHHRLTQLRQVRTWQLLIVLIFALLVSASLLRLNNLNMIDHISAVKAADKTGDKQAIKQKLLELQRYVTSHMNTSLGQGIYLQESFERDRGSAIEAAGNTANPAAEVYKQASVECRSRFQGGVESYRNDYVRCVQERVAALGSADEIASASLPMVENYHYNFLSPQFSFDLAGLSVAFCGLLVLIIFSRWAMLLILRLLLKHRYKSI